MQLFGIPDNPAVDESPEAETYAEALRAPVAARQDGDGVTVTMGAPFEVVRLAFAKTDAGLAEIADWSDGAPLFLDPDIPTIPPDDPDDDPGPDEDLGDDADTGDDGGIGIAVALLALLPLVFLAR
jgi:hypothetical protein